MKFPRISYQQWLIPFILLFCSFLLYLNTFNGAWLMDDFSVIVNNPDIRTFSNFLLNSFPGRPLREITYLLDYSVFGLDPWGYHFQNIFWHFLNCWLVFLLASRLNLSRTVACISSFLFLVHPIHVEVVANSSHRKDSLALAFLLLALLSYMKIFEQKTTQWRLSWLTFSILLWITAFYAKGNSLVFPVIVLAYEYAVVPEENRLIVRWRSMIPLLCGFSTIGLIAWYWYISTLISFKMAIIGAFVKTENLVDFSTFSYILMVLKSFAFMLSKLIIPLNLSMEYIYSVPKSFMDIWVLFALLLIPSLFVLALRWKRTSPELFFLLLFSAALWFPTANIVWHFAYFAADRYMYAPSAGLCIIAALLSEQLLLVARRYLILGWICILCILAFLTWKQSNVWHDDYSLYSNMLLVSPRSLEAMFGLSNAYYHLKDYESATKFAKVAMERDFTDYRPYLMLGNINYVHGRLKEALELMLESKQKNKLAPEIYNSIGSVYDDLGKTDLAIDAFKTAIQLRPDYVEAYTNLGATYEHTNRYSEAELMLNKALLANSNHISAWYTLGVVRYKQNNKSGARLAFSEAVKRNPAHIDALTNLTIVCKEIGDNDCYNDAKQRLAAQSAKSVR